MTLLEILAERLDKEAAFAISMATRFRIQKRPLRAEYYRGKVVAYRLSADMLCKESLARESVSKEV